MTNDDIKQMLPAYNIEPVAIRHILTGGKNNDLYEVHTIEERYILKRLSSPSYTGTTLAYENKLLEHLTSRITTFNVPVPVRDKYGAYHVNDGVYHYVLIPLYKGQSLDLRLPHHITLLASVYGEMHTVTATMTSHKRDVLSPFNDFFNFAMQRVDIFNLSPDDLHIATTPQTHQLTKWWNKEAQNLSDFLESTYSTLPGQLCHNDITPGNILHDNGKVSVLLDFEFMTVTGRAFDIATGLRHVMRIWETPEPWQNINQFFTEYNRWCRLSPSEVDALPDLLRLRSAIAIIWWTGRAKNLNGVPTLIRYYQTMTEWLRQYRQQLISFIHETQKMT